MSALLGTISTLVRPILLSKGAPKVRIDDWTFRIHYRLTSLLLFLFSALVCMKEFLGDHIKCVHMQEDDSNDPVIPRKVLETYCFIMTTFTVPYDKKTSIIKMDHMTSTSLGGPPYIPGKTEQVFHAYYQWVPFYLFFLGLCFVVPHVIWKAVDNGKLKHLVQELNVPELPINKSLKGRQISLLAKYIVTSSGEHWGWAMAYFFCELGNLAVLGGTIYLTDIFLGKEFSTYGPEVLKFLEKDPEDRQDPMSKVFPRVTKCNLNTFGPSGTIQKFDALCILPLNIINEKIFTFLWFWLAAVAVVTLFTVMYRLLTLMSRKVRGQALATGSSDKEFPVKDVVQQLTTTDWVLLHLLRQNMDQITFEKLIFSIDEHL